MSPLSSKGALPASGAFGSSALEEESEDELLEELEPLLGSEPGMGGAELGKGNLSAAEGCFPSGVGASGELRGGADFCGVDSPGKGKRSEAEGSLLEVGGQGESWPFLWLFLSTD